MFSNLIDKRHLQNRTLIFSVTTIILWGLQLLFLIIILQSVKSYLHHSIQDDLQRSMTAFIQQNQNLISSPDRYASVFDEKSLRGLDFVRIIKNNEQLLYSVLTDHHLDFKSLAELDPSRSGSWLPLFDNNSAGQIVWNVASFPVLDTLVVQVGSRDRYLYGVYKNLVRFAWYAAIPALLAALLLAYVGLRLSLFPLNYLAQRLLTVHTDKEGLLDSSSGTREHQVIYRRINDIIVQNRRLVTEIQGSLDNVAHDLRTPMTRLRSVAEYGLQAGHDPEKLRDALSDCLEESERVLSMLKFMMSVAEAESGTMKLEFSDIDISVNLAEIVELYEYSAQEENVAIVLDAPAGLWIRGDRSRLSQVWANLLDNGIKYNRPQGSVRISVHPAGRRVAVIFEDSGMGISPHEIERIWERLYRGDRSRSRQGLGLGLNYVKAVIKAHDGTIHVESRLNEGTTFRVELERTTASKSA
ncbi:MAG: HAMP domain-containing sensor histidine kinase [Desulfocapsaceae bacterium]|jgi:signal transduction histidine kinase|nr:HAMP domain-containing sensor histidine kinase [Desulfocapsaceae bacterium]